MLKALSLRKYQLLIAALVVLADRAAKWLVETRIALYDSISVAPGFFSLVHAQNRGAAFSMFANSPGEGRVTGLIVASVLGIVVAAVLLWKSGPALTATSVGLSLVLGGAMGNLWDRLVYGHVTDFLDFHLGRYEWPAFNVADSAITVGAFLLVADILFGKPEEAIEPTGRQR